MMDGVFLEDVWDYVGCFKLDMGGVIEVRSFWRDLLCVRL